MPRHPAFASSIFLWVHTGKGNNKEWYYWYNCAEREAQSEEKQTPEQNWPTVTESKDNEMLICHNGYQLSATRWGNEYTYETKLQLAWRAPSQIWISRWITVMFGYNFARAQFAYRNRPNPECYITISFCGVRGLGVIVNGLCARVEMLIKLYR